MKIKCGKNWYPLFALRQWCENGAWKVCHSLGTRRWEGRCESRKIYIYQENWVNRHTRVWLEAWSTTETDRDALGSVSSKASSMFSWGKTGGLTEPLMSCEDANQEKSKSRYGKINKYAQLGIFFYDPFKKPRWLTGFKQPRQLWSFGLLSLCGV